MINVSSDFDLAKDTTRIKDRLDGERQRHTAQELLARYFRDDVGQRLGLQLVADEVGMGKTFVALAAAYSILRAMRDGVDDPDLRGCAPRILVIAPPNGALVKKWVREVKEFVRRCALEEARSTANEIFTVEQVDRLDELAMRLRSKTAASVLAALSDSAVRFAA